MRLQDYVELGGLCLQDGFETQLQIEGDLLFKLYQL